MTSALLTCFRSAGGAAARVVRTVVVAMAVAAIATLTACSSGTQHTAGASSASTSVTVPAADVVVGVSTSGASIRLHTGQVMRVTLPPSAQGPGQTTKYTLSPATTKSLTPIADAPGFFTAATAGTVKIVVTQTPACPPGSACPAHIVDIGSVTVTVLA